MKTLRIKITLTEEMLGTASANKEIHEAFIASKAPDAKTREEEVAAIGVDAAVEKTMTLFPRVKASALEEWQRPAGASPEALVPIMWDYQVKGFFKDAASMLNRVEGTKTKDLKAFKKVIDGLIFPKPRAIALHLPAGESIGNCQRPLRAQTPQGERVALANSETVPMGTTLTFDVVILEAKNEVFIREWLDYGAFRGLGQWRNSGKGRFTWQEITA